MKRTFLDDDFLLQGESARRLYHQHAAGCPIWDYHCHLSPKDLAENRRFASLFEIWLEGDHYKWRAMRANGVEERYCTGEADPYEKFLAWARTVPTTLRNPLYHWTHLELRRYFDIDLLLDERTAPEIWQEANRRLADDDLRPWGIARKFRVKVIGTTDDPLDGLEHHRALAGGEAPVRVFPTFRPDRALAIRDGLAFVEYAERLGQATGADTHTYEGFQSALRAKHSFFHEHGARLSDHGLTRCHAAFASESDVAAIYDKGLRGKAISPEECERFATAVMVLSGELDSERGWVKQLHLGALRNPNSRMFAAVGRDAGFDTIGEAPQGEALAAYLDHLDSRGALPKTILYNNNPRDNYLFAALIGAFQGGAPGKIQFGSGWWFLDQKEAIEWQLNALSNNGLLSRFVGMLTDSRSFLSYPRHEYFRRVLCNLLGNDMDRGELPDDFELIGGLVEDICHRNAESYFPFP